MMMVVEAGSAIGEGGREGGRELLITQAKGIRIKKAAVLLKEEEE